MKKFLFPLLTALGMATGCQASDAYKDLDVNQFATFTEHPDVQVVDVRRADEYNEGHLAGAINIDVLGAGFVDKADKELNKEYPVAVYCRSGRRSAQAADELAAQGFQVVNMAGGILAWQKAGLPVVR